ncbi:MAG TPA: endonuclease domain-containing protein [Spirochaetota bacterium]|nr:endonuclease domain-containing protein [Spirochaetota bacterium]HRZ28277.1 endonuclease domain-containing protein [Spirochaetota bacterium]HSA15337.1 endonuclease domain-containing protein [Spirochaetota bacterium]
MPQKLPTPNYVIELARDLRNNLTESEKILWSELRKKQLDGHKFRCQHPLYRYILDFYCHEKRLAIEIDGKIHNSKKEYDKYRDEFLQSLDIKTLRVIDKDVLNEIEIVKEMIKKELSMR